jgi:glycosyltransferase involved in cell wall biosynthesis
MTPFPPDGGAEIRSYHLMRLLAEHYEVTALCLWRAGDSATGAAARISGLNEIPGVKAIGFPRVHGVARSVLSHARSLATSRVYTTYTVYSPTYRAELERLLAANQFDIIHVDSLDLAAYLPLLPLERVVCGHHNIESSLLRRRASAERSRIRRGYIRYQAKLMEVAERRWCPVVALNVMVSSADAHTMERLAPGSQTVVVPNGVDTSTYVPAQSERHGLVFVGGTSWFPNRDALSYFAFEILPRIRERMDVPVVWVGHADRASRAIAQRAGITMTGFVSDIRPYVHASACFIVPLRVGGGTRLKILDAWAMGSAVVSTSIGCEGLDAVDGLNIQIRDDPEGFATAVAEVLDDPTLRETLGQSGRRTAEVTYSWDVIGRDMIPRYTRVNGR